MKVDRAEPWGDASARQQPRASWGEGASDAHSGPHLPSYLQTPDRVGSESTRVTVGRAGSKRRRGQNVRYPNKWLFSIRDFAPQMPVTVKDGGSHSLQICIGDTGVQVLAPAGHMRPERKKVQAAESTVATISAFAQHHPASNGAGRDEGN
jgi:hypothetical protein